MSQFINNSEHTFGFDTLQLHVGQESADPASDARAVPIYQTTSYVFRNSQHAADRFGLADAGNIYGRLTNSTQGVFEDRIAALEGGVAGLAVASGAAAITYALQALAQAGDHVVAQKTIYGGSYNLLEHTLSQFGVETTFVDAHSLDEVEGAIKDNTTVIYLETLGNPNSDIPNIDAISEIAKKHGLPVVVDNTFGTPYLFRPLEHGANIVVHSATKFIGGHGTSLGGVIVDHGQFDWMAHADKFPGLTTPDESYHGVTYAEKFGREGAFITKATAQLMRDLGPMQNPQAAFFLNSSLESLHVRMPRHVENGLAVAKFLQSHPKVRFVSYPGLEGDKYYDLAQKYMPNGTCGVVSFGFDGGRAAAETFMKSLKLAQIATHVADARTCCLHPANATHRQMNDEELIACGISADMVRLSCGLEDTADLIADLEQALEQC